MKQGAPGVVFNTDNLFDGRPWRVLWKTNTAWQRFFDPFNDLADNRAYQKYEKVMRRCSALCCCADRYWSRVKNCFHSRRWILSATQRYLKGWLDSLASAPCASLREQDGSVTNIAQAFGHKLYVTVDGQGAPVSASTKLPYEVSVCMGLKLRRFSS